MSNRSTEFAGQLFELHPSGALFWPNTATLILGDLHLEKASSYHRSGQFLPPYDTSQTLTRLAAVCEELAPDRLILLGDVFHDGNAWQRMSAADKDQLFAILDGRDVVWIEGNHDQSFVPPGHTGQNAVLEQGIVMRHIMEADEPRPEISAHFHPSATIFLRGVRLRRPCFVKTTTRLLLPSFGVLTGGLDCRDAALSGLHGQSTQIFMLGDDQVFAPPPGLTSQDVGGLKSDRWR